MMRREGGRRRLSFFCGLEFALGLDASGAGEDEGEGEADRVELAEGEGARDVPDAEGVMGRERAFAFERSIQGFSGGIRGSVYCARAWKDISHRFGAQTPTSTRHAATRRFALGIASAVILGLEAEPRVQGPPTDRSCLQVSR